MSEERNERGVFEGESRQPRGADRRKTPRRKSDLLMTLLKYLSVALVASLLVKFLG